MTGNSMALPTPELQNTTSDVLNVPSTILLESYRDRNPDVIKCINLFSVHSA
jgi:hypothetical protein